MTMNEQHNHNDEAEQNEPVLHGSLDATDDEKRQGIVDQVQADSPGLSFDDVLFRLTQRLSDSEVPTSVEQIQGLAERIVNGRA